MRVVLDTNILISALWSKRTPGGDLSCLAGRVFHAPDLRGAAGRVAGHAAQTRDRRAHQAL